jgi:2-aminoadipate transaminase
MPRDDPPFRVHGHLRPLLRKEGMMETLWTQRYAQRTQRMQSSAIRELLKLTEQPEMISFAGGLPAPGS